MGAKSGSGSIVSSVPSSIFETSNFSNTNCSVKSRAGLSSSRSSNKYAPQEEIEIYNERQRLLNSYIDEIKIGIEPIGEEHFHSISYYSKPIKILLPTYLGGGCFIYHASCFLRLSCGDDIILEYGGYSGGDANYRNYIHYAEEDGMRFSRMNFSDYLNKIKSGTKGSEILSSLYFQNIMPLQELINRCNNGSKKWVKGNYNLASYNCQDFVAKVIEVLEVKRCNEDNTKFLHNYSISTYPPVIIKALEKNEKTTLLTALESLPIIGIIVEDGACLGHKIKYN